MQGVSPGHPAHCQGRHRARGLPHHAGQGAGGALLPQVSLSIVCPLSPMSLLSLSTLPLSVQSRCSLSTLPPVCPVCPVCPLPPVCPVSPSVCPLSLCLSSPLSVRFPPVHAVSPLPVQCPHCLSRVCLKVDSSTVTDVPLGGRG